MTEIGKILLGIGLLVIILGAALVAVGTLSGKVPWLGRLPGDIYIEREGWRLYVPLGTSLLVSAVLSLLAALFWRR
jgi:hypothetical protein